MLHDQVLALRKGEAWNLFQIIWERHRYSIHPHLTAAGAGLAHVSTCARRNTWLGSTVAWTQTCTSPHHSPYFAEAPQVHKKSESRCENPSLCTLCNSAKLLLLLLLISTRWHQWGLFPFLHPPSQSVFYHELDLSVQRTQFRCSDSAKARGILQTHGSQGFFSFEYKGCRKRKKSLMK